MLGKTRCRKAPGTYVLGVGQVLGNGNISVRGLTQFLLLYFPVRPHCGRAVSVPLAIGSPNQQGLYLLFNHVAYL